MISICKLAIYFIVVLALVPLACEFSSIEVNERLMSYFVIITRVKFEYEAVRRPCVNVGTVKIYDFALH